MAPRSVLVTGGGAGLGEAVARRCVAEGDRVAVLDVDADAVERVAADVGAIPLVASVTDGRAVGAALDAFGPPDLTVSAAGIVAFGPLLELDEADWRRVVEVNLTGSFVVARAVAQRLVAAGRGGAIVVLTSINGRAPGLHAGAYGSTKAGTALLVRQMAQEWADHGIRVNAVAPGLIDGGMSAPIYADPAARAARRERVPLGRLGEVGDVTEAVLWLASDAASYVTGQELVVDGGVTDSVMATLPRPASVDTVGHGGPTTGGATS